MAERWFSEAAGFNLKQVGTAREGEGVYRRRAEEGLCHEMNISFEDF
jgi:hypothetical protein